MRVIDEVSARITPGYFDGSVLLVEVRYNKDGERQKQSRELHITPDFTESEFDYIFEKVRCSLKAALEHSK